MTALVHAHPPVREAQDGHAGDGGRWVRAALLSDLSEDRPHVVQAAGATVVLFLHQGGVFAVDNRCPHMGFPLQKGTVKDGILTCHWHNARFDLKCGGTFDLWADDVRSYPVELRKAGDSVEVWLDPQPPARDPLAYYGGRLLDGLKYNLRLVIAKAVIGLLRTDGGAEEALRIGAEFGTVYAANGWSAGLTILTAMANLLPVLRPEDRPVALYQGLVHVARDCAGQAPRFPIAPLPTAGADAGTLKRWFREFVERRDRDGAERALRTAIDAGLDRQAVADMIFAACTDHLYRDIGHPMDFANKAFELLDLVGWDSAGVVLTSLLPRIVNSSRMEESSSWRHPIDIAALLWDAFAELDDCLAAGALPGRRWLGAEALAQTILSSEPAGTVRTMLDALRAGATPLQLSSAVTHAATLRIAHFHTRNEYGDWDTVLHTFTYANAIRQAMRLAPSAELLRGVFDGAMSVYLDRFLNTPPAPLPDAAAAPADIDSALLDLLDRQQQVAAAGKLAASALAGEAGRTALIAALGHGLLREDSGFHTFQCVEGAAAQQSGEPESSAGRCALIAAARYLAAHSPTARSMNQTYDIALRLHRGEALYEG